MSVRQATPLPSVDGNWASPIGTTPRLTGVALMDSESSPIKLAWEQVRLAENRQNLGLLGKLFGSRDTAPTNSAGLAILLGLFFFIGSYLLMPSPELSPVQAGALGVVGSALGYIFGSASRIER